MGWAIPKPWDSRTLTHWAATKTGPLLCGGVTVFAPLLMSVSLILSGVFLIVNVATAAPEQPVSYDSTPVDGLEYSIERRDRQRYPPSFFYMGCRHLPGCINRCWNPA
jgi:hypothetical protein